MARERNERAEWAVRLRECDESLCERAAGWVAEWPEWGTGKWVEWAEL